MYPIIFGQMKTDNIGQPIKDVSNIELMLKVDQIVQISNGASIDKRLVGYKNGYASIKAKYEHSVDLKIWEHEIKNVAINDIKLAPLNVPITVNLSHQRYLLCLTICGWRTRRSCLGAKIFRE